MPQCISRRIVRLAVVLIALAAGCARRGEAADEEGQIVLTAQFAAATADEPATLYIVAEIPEGWHTFSITQPKGGPRATKITLTPSDDYKLLEKSFTASPPPETRISEIWPDLPVEEHTGRVVWHIPIEIADGVDPQALKIEGKINAQRCRANTCVAPKNFPFTATLGEGVKLGGEEETAASPPGDVPREGERGPPVDGGALGGFDPSKAVLRSATQDLSFVVVLVLAFLGGLILNVMPCVLPVIGLKILAFVEQAGESRARVLLLNVWYSLGMMSVFMVLATLAVLFGQNWGEQFTSVIFNVVLASVVFVLALSFLGVWEIPIPGFVGGSKTANELAQKEGAVGAFSKGVLTTVLATPCTGPFMGTALTWAVGQSMPVAYATFASMGLGMAAPYLLIGAFPALIRVLPRPGAWMGTFKQTMGFVLLGTVVFVLTFLRPTWNVVPTVAFLVGLWAACWWLGRTPLTATLGIKVRAWCASATFAMLMALVSFGWLTGVMQRRANLEIEAVVAERLQDLGGSGTLAPVRNEGGQLPWQPFLRATLQDLTASQTTVLVDFTADW